MEGLACGTALLHYFLSRGTVKEDLPFLLGVAAAQINLPVTLVILMPINNQLHNEEQCRKEGKISLSGRKLRKFECLKFEFKIFECEKEVLKKELKDFEKSGSSYSDNEDYLAFKQNLIKSMIRKLKVLELEASVTGTKKEVNLRNHS